ncbi:HAD-IA family hydrolase [Roseivivax sp. THAF30]|uniref:HAD-IA family hydrolase n=1 Tax=Roseivivax sp. THAF30 TaxID=2587852 RepID=UPI0012692F9F|nr:HAD-IA family hydrolase [Roseivivax sp. THAF30]QFT64119.1 Phosphoglycolate phosphatase [Roseivivax sp. THAF30]
MRSVIFDLDGTLADTSGDLIAAANLCLSEMGATTRLDPQMDARTAFRGARAMLKLGLEREGAYSPDTVETWYPRLLEAYGADISRHTTLYPGAMEAVAALSASGFRVGICTNKPEGLAEQLLADLGIRDAFASMIGADTLPVRKPDPEPLREAIRRAGGTETRAVLVGDTETDRETARAAGLASVLVGFGPEGSGIARLKPEAIIGHYDELHGVALRLLGD